MPTTPEEKCHVWDETTKELIRQTGCRTYIPWLRQILQKMISETWWWMQSAHLCPVLAVTWFLKSWENEIDVGLSLLFLQKHLLKTHCYLHNSPVADLDRWPCSVPLILPKFHQFLELSSSLNSCMPLPPASHATVHPFKRPAAASTISSTAIASVLSDTLPCPVWSCSSIFLCLHFVVDLSPPKSG